VIAVIERGLTIARRGLKIQTVDGRSKTQENRIAAFGDVLRADFVRVSGGYSEKVNQDWMQRFRRL